MKGLVFLIVFFLHTANCVIAQNNLIRNGSFEQSPICSSVIEATYWTEINSSDWYCGGLGYPTVQQPKDSFNYYGMGTLINETSNPLNMFSREMMQQQLTQTLQLNKKYCCRFYINLLGNYSCISHSNFGAYFSSTAANGNPMAVWTTQDWLEYTPQVKNPIGAYPDTTNWLEVSGTFIANGTEQFITLGNFDSVDVLDYIVLTPPPPLYFEVSYMLLDDVSLVEVLPITLQPKHTLCLGDSVTLASTTIYDATYNWSPINGLSCTNCAQPKASPNTTTQYTLVVRQCDVIDTLYTTVTVIPNTSTQAQTIEDAVFCEGSTIVIGNNTQDSASYTWFPSQGLNQNTIANPIATIQNDITYVVTKVYCGLTTTDSVSITVKDCVPELFIPNIFSPNGDNINDVFQIKTNEYSLLKTIIFDRWGVKVFESDNTQPRWDGRTTLGKVCNAGTYYYSIEGETNMQEKINKQGFLELVR